MTRGDAGKNLYDSLTKAGDAALHEVSERVTHAAQAKKARETVTILGGQQPNTSVPVKPKE